MTSKLIVEQAETKITEAMSIRLEEAGLVKFIKWTINWIGLPMFSAEQNEGFSMFSPTKHYQDVEAVNLNLRSYWFGEPTLSYWLDVAWKRDAK